MSQAVVNTQNNSKIVMVFDTETSGLPLKRPGSRFSPYNDIDLYNNCRLVQFSGIIYDFNMNETLAEFDYTIKPDGFTINNSNIHGITMDIANKNGISINKLFEKIIELFQKHNISKLVGHNVIFDINVIKSEMFRYMKKSASKFSNFKKNRKITIFLYYEKHY